MEDVMMTASIGMAVSGWSCIRSVLKSGQSFEEVQTLLTNRHPGRPLSRAKAQTNRDAVAKKAIVPAASMMMIIAIITEAPAFEPVAS